MEYIKVESETDKALIIQALRLASERYAIHQQTINQSDWPEPNRTEILDHFRRLASRCADLASNIDADE